MKRLKKGRYGQTGAKRKDAKILSKNQYWQLVHNRNGENI